ncbi:MAG: translesion DNA synthesis-associated protein ImuA [Halioglobus sp.]
MNTNEMLEQVTRRNDTWRGRQRHFQGQCFSANSELHSPAGLPTGYATLDAQLQQGGWPLDSTIELLSDGCGMGAMGLFLPAMERLSEQARWQVFIAPPYIPYAPLLAARGIDTRQVLLVHPQNRKDLLWATEQALRSTTCSAVFSWLGARDYDYGELRKLQLAAASGDSLAVLFRPNQACHNHAPSSLRLQMREYRKVHILKQRGGNQSVDVELPPADDVPQQPQLWELPAVTASGQHGAAMGACGPA